MIDTILTAGDRLTLRFFRRGDRWQHIVECREAGQLIWQLESAAAAVETADDNWPCSPPFQSLELHSERDDRRFALLVGMAGASHWSASVEVDADRERFVFDVACRVKSEPMWLGTCYMKNTPHPRPLSHKGRGEDGVALSGEGRGEKLIPLSPGGRGVRGEGEALPSNPTIPLVEPIETLPTTERMTIEASDRRIIIRADDRPRELPRTVRWKFAITATH